MAAKACWGVIPSFTPTISTKPSEAAIFFIASALQQSAGGAEEEPALGSSADCAGDPLELAGLRADAPFPAPGLRIDALFVAGSAAGCGAPVLAVFVEVWAEVEFAPA